MSSLLTNTSWHSRSYLGIQQILEKAFCKDYCIGTLTWHCHFGTPTARTSKPDSAASSASYSVATVYNIKSPSQISYISTFINYIGCCRSIPGTEKYKAPSPKIVLALKRFLSPLPQVPGTHNVEQQEDVHTVLLKLPSCR